MEEFKRIWEEYRKTVEEALNRFLPPEDDYPQNLYKAMRYAVFSGGKRLRPVLTLATAEALGQDPKALLPQAVAIELIHTFTLVHDDLPDIDNDDFRRGKPTLHRVFGNAIAILAGDALFAYAFRVATEGPLPAETKLQILREINDALSYKGVIEGQVADIESLQRDPTYEDMLFIHTHKTGKLIEASVVVGALGSHASSEKVASLREYGRNVGLAFQIMDDILDAVGDEKEVGKRLRKDFNRASAVRILGLERAKEEMDRLVREAVASVKESLGIRGEFLVAMAHFIKSRTY
ncbi:MAG: polyprenyl synthetase family protein [Thermotogae bacterium]|nr:polyprenyl synthetase family protein [Thermotogota bacterium]